PPSPKLRRHRLRVVPTIEMDIAVEPATAGGDPATVRWSERGRRRPAGRVDGEKDAFGERVYEDGAAGVDERDASGRLERRRIRAHGIGGAGGAVTGVLQVAGEVVMLERRDDQHRRIQHDEPLEEPHDLAIQGYPKRGRLRRAARHSRYDRG